MTSNITERLKRTFGGIPSFIEDNINCLKFNGKHFVCEPCDKPIEVVFNNQATQQNELINPIADTKERDSTVKEASYQETITNEEECTNPDENAGVANCDASTKQLGPTTQNTTTNRPKVTINQNATTKHFQDHLLSDCHQGNIPSKDKLFKNLNKMYREVYSLKGLEKKIPQIILVNLPFLCCQNKTFYCTLCGPENFRVGHYMNVPRTEEEFYRHLLSDYHIEKRKGFNDKCNEVRVGLESVYGTIPSFVLDNVEFINENNGDYSCNPCKKQLQVHSCSVDDTIEEFKVHLQSLDHKKQIEKSRALQNVPELKNLYSSELPHYIIRNIDYIKCDDEGFFCSVCQVGVGLRRDHDKYKTEQSLKAHLLSFKHTDNLLKRRDPQNEVFKRLHEMFETFPNDVLENLSWLGRKGNDFYCHLCKQKIKDKNDSHYTVKNLLSHFVPRYKDVFNENSIHEENLKEERKRLLSVTEKLKGVFPSMPEVIQDNIEYMRFLNDDFVECVVCEVKRQFYPGDPTRTLNSLKCHLDSKRHLNCKVGEQQNLEQALNEHLSFTPQFITQNITHIGHFDTSDIKEYSYAHGRCGSDSDDDEYYHRQSEGFENQRVAGLNFYCYLCKVVITTGKAPRYEKDDTTKIARPSRLTEYNFRDHLLSRAHQYKIRNKSINDCYVKNKFESIFGMTPDFVQSNLRYIDNYYGGLKCTLCDSHSYLSTDHFRNGTYDFDIGKKHKENIKALENDNNLAMTIFDMRFWMIPEFILKNLDFLSISGLDFFCELCQETLYMNEYDLECTESEFRRHMNSKKHKSSLHFEFRNWPDLPDLFRYY